MSFISHILKWKKEILTNKNNKRDQNLWIFGEWWTKRCCDNSMYLANYIAEHEPDIQCVWITNRETDTSMLSERVSRAYLGEPDAGQYIKTAGVVVMNQNLQDFGIEFDFRCSGALIVNLWHGVAWKHIGVDGIHSERKLYKLYQSYVLKLQHFDLFLCPAEIYEKIYLKTFCLCSSDKLLRTGQPRNAFFYDKAKCDFIRKQVYKQLQIPDDARMLLYLPTFRDSGSKIYSFTDLRNSEFEQWLHDENIYIVQKAHFKEGQNDSLRKKRIIFENSISAQTLMAASDLLITDYSSCFFDYLILNRPIVHYLYDYDFYANDDRGLYFDKDEIVCGSVADTETKLITEIKKNMENPLMYQELRQKRMETYMQYESPQACEQIKNQIFESLKTKQRSV